MLSILANTHYRFYCYVFWAQQMIQNTIEEEHLISFIYFVDTLLMSVYIAVTITMTC